MADQVSDTPDIVEGQDTSPLVEEHASAVASPVPLEKPADDFIGPRAPSKTSGSFKDAADNQTTINVDELPKEVRMAGQIKKDDGTAFHFAEAMGDTGDMFSALMALLAMLFKDPEMFPFMKDMMFPEKTYTDPVERQERIENFETVLMDKNHADRDLPATEFVGKYIPHMSSGQDTLLRPGLSKRLAKDGPSQFKSNVDITVKAIEDYNSKLQPDEVKLDTNLVLNQIYQESRFNADAVGPPTKYGTALGAAQFLPSTGEKYGLHNRADFFNPSKALPAAVQHIGDMTQKYGDQRLAMVAYNGGGGAVDWAADKLGKPLDQLTINDWMGYTDGLNKKLGEGPKNLWRNQTNEYVALSHSDYWDESKKAEAMALMEKAGMIEPEKLAENTATPEMGPPAPPTSP